MEEKLERLKQFNKSKQLSRRKKCRWCKEEVKPDALICASCQQPQRKRYWIFSHPTILISSLSFIVSVISFWVAINPSPAAPRVGAHHLEYDDQKFMFATFNYGDAPTFLTALRLKVSLVQKETTHEAYSYYYLDEPVFLPVGSSPETLSIEYDAQAPDQSRWEATGGQDVFGLSFLYGAASLGKNLNCEITLWYSASGTASNRDSSISRSNGSCVSAMEWMAKDFGPLKDNPLSDPVLRHRASHGAQDQ